MSELHFSQKSDQSSDCLYCPTARPLPKGREEKINVGDRAIKKKSPFCSNPFAPGRQFPLIQHFKGLDISSWIEL